MVNFELPAIFDPVLTYLADTLPPPLYSFVINALSHCLALVSAITTLFASVLSRNPLEWDAQTLLPPLISLLAAYLALSGLYRTTTWMIRTSFWFMKWTIILGALVAGVGWYMATQGEAGGLTNTSIMSYISNRALDMINGPNRNAAGTERNTHTRTSRSRTRPKPWESFARHREWQYTDDQSVDETSDVEKLFSNLIGAAGRVFGDNSWWWTGMKNLMDTEDQSSRRTGSENGRTRSGANSKSRSR